VIRGVHHVAISTPDAERLLGFYRDLLEFEVVVDFSWGPGVAIADTVTGLEGASARQLMLRAGNFYVEFFEYRTPEPRPGDPARPVCDHGITHICLDVTGLDAEYERLPELGVEFVSPPQDLGGGVRTLYSRDPDGNVVEMQELASDRHPVALP
jgi:catechol 2,3-dioxygenase-like lactoylglutathione lyase family enzyme